MGFDWKKIMSVLGSISSPKQAVNLLLGKIGEKNPETAGALKKMINSGENPSKVLQELSSEGTINLEQLAQIKSYYDFARRLGFKHQIPNSEWQKAEKAIRAGLKGSGQPPTGGGSGGFTGF